MPRILIFESHPVQYKAPVYQALNRLLPDAFEIIYATDASLRPDNLDVEFGEKIAWDVPLLEGYRYRVLGNETRLPIGAPDSLSGRGVFRLLRRERPSAIVLTSLRYRIDQVAYFSALLLRIPILIRQETQDEMYASRRTWLKNWLRFLAYKAIYAPVRHAFAFGELNYAHLRRHGIKREKISYARFSVPNPFEEMSDMALADLRETQRRSYRIASNEIVITFVGKLIPKKNPDLLFAALPHLPQELTSRMRLMFVGSGQLTDDLQQLAERASKQWKIDSIFAGFVNQSRLPPYYLATDVLVLPSRRMGEAWGLVVNEALNAGCAAVVTDAVGCHPEFNDLERVRVIPTESAASLAKAIQQLVSFPRQFRWAEAHMQEYSTGAAAMRIREGLLPYIDSPFQLNDHTIENRANGGTRAIAKGGNPIKSKQLN